MDVYARKERMRWERERRVGLLDAAVRVYVRRRVDSGSIERGAEGVASLAGVVEVTEDCECVLLNVVEAGDVRTARPPWRLRFRGCPCCISNPEWGDWETIVRGGTNRL